MPFCSTEIRKASLTDFLTSYRQCCVLQNAVPLKIVTASFCANCLSLDASKIRVSDWPPLLRAISTAKKLQKLRFVSTWRVGVRPTPIIHQDQSPVVKQIVLALKQLLSKRNDLRELSIEKIPIFIPPLIELGNALEQQTCRLSYLSLSGCQIGDLGFSKLQRFLSRRDVVSRLDLSGCDLSPVAMTIIIDTLKARMLRGSGQFWRENLRNATDHVEESHFNGIRVLKLNENARLADSITPLLTAIIYDDLRLASVIRLGTIFRCESSRCDDTHFLKK
jgi:hypothetical protein